MSKFKFEREAMGAGVPVESYYTGNGIYTSKDCNRELRGKGQGIRHCVVVGHNHNGLAYNAIKDVVIISITMIIHATLRWPDDSDNSIWPMVMAFDVHLHNHNTHTSIGISPEEVCTRSN